MSEICQNCKHWYPRVGAGNVGTCRRFPAKVTTHPHEMCGEWEQGEPRRVSGPPPLAHKADDSQFVEGMAKASAAIDKAKKGGRR